MADAFSVSVVYATPDMEVCVPVQLMSGSTIADAIRASGLSAKAPGIDVGALKAGLWGKLKPVSTILREGDRVEVYRPLKADPNTARQHRVAKKRAAAGK
jgi:putative ubiquitin-RnfH superfamily antitoxin RatB of RatAB toxin-antitoxin module